MPQCKKCFQKIIWKTGEDGKYIPCNPTSVMYTNMGFGLRILTRKGEIIRGEIVPESQKRLSEGRGYVLHWDTCPESKQNKEKDNPKYRQAKKAPAAPKPKPPEPEYYVDFIKGCKNVFQKEI